MKKIISLTIEALGFIFSILADFILALIDLAQKQNGHEARFGSEFDIANRFNRGFVISKYRKLTRKRSFENLLLAGPTGSGKTVRVLAKQLFEIKNACIIVNDPSKELYYLLSGYLSQFFELLILNFSDSTTSAGYNIISRLTPNEVNKVAHMLVAASLEKGSSGDPFWSLQSKSLLAIFIQLILHQEAQYQNMANVIRLLNVFSTSPQKIDGLIAKTNDQKLILDYKALITIPEKTLLNCVLTAKTALQFFDSPEISKVTAFDTIDLDSFRNKPRILFLHNSISDMKFINILNGIFFEQVYGHILKKLPEKDELDLFIILEEASSLHIPILATAIANTRKHRVGNLICVQSPQQLKSLYKDEAENISANCVTKIFLPGQTSMDSLRELETLSGKCSYKDKKGIEKVKSLITVDEIRLLHENRSLILCSNNPIIKGRTSPYFRSRKYRKFSQIPPAPMPCHIPSGPIPLLQL